MSASRALVPSNQPPYDLVALKVALREANTALDKLVYFEKLFDQFCEPLRQAVEQFHGDRWAPEGTVVNAVVLKADAMRLELAEMQEQLLPRHRDPLAKLLRTSLRTDSRALRELLGEVAAVDFGDALYLISIPGCERTIAEARSVIAERRHELNADVRRLTATIEEVSSEQGTQRAHELALAQTHASAAVKAQVKKGLWWLFGGGIRTAILWGLSLLLTALAVFAFGPKAKAWFDRSATARDSTSVQPPATRPPTP
jgi:hypothetical protein